MKRTHRIVTCAAAGAALLVTLTGCRNYLAFSTATKFGLDISQRADQQPEVTLGYQRAEVASIPVREHREVVGKGAKKAKAKLAELGASYAGDADATNDAYAVLGSFRVQYDATIIAGGVHIHQLFATGLAAREAAKDPAMGLLFGLAASNIVHAGKP